MALKDEIYPIISKIDALHIEDPTISVYWDQLAAILSRDEKKTIQFLRELEDENAINNISSVFDDIAFNLNSRDFITCIESLQAKFPDLPLEGMIDAARDSMDTDSREP